MARIGEVALARLGDRRPASFRVLTKRSDKTFPVPSPEVSRIVGAAIKVATGARVDLEDAALTVTVDIVPERAYVSLEKQAGAGGLPVSTSGRVLGLLSGIGKQLGSEVDVGATLMPYLLGSAAS